MGSIEESTPKSFNTLQSEIERRANKQGRVCDGWRKEGGGQLRVNKHGGVCNK